MPTFDYLCQDCEQRFEELFLSISQIPAQALCPVCGSGHTRRLISAPAARVAGEGRCSPPEESAGDGKRLEGPVFGRKELNQLPKK